MSSLSLSRSLWLFAAATTGSHFGFSAATSPPPGGLPSWIPRFLCIFHDAVLSKRAAVLVFLQDQFHMLAIRFFGIVLLVTGRG